MEDKMQREQFIDRLKTLASDAAESDDIVVRHSASVLYGLLGAITAGDGFFEPFIDTVAVLVRNQHDALVQLINRTEH